MKFICLWKEFTDIIPCLTVVKLNYFYFHRWTTIYSGTVVVESCGNTGIYFVDRNGNSYNNTT